MLNKILSKKIKYSLSLRGLFPFCHSREGGNPSSQSLRSDRSNLSGFSLIELMVAVTILAMAIFGIFHAYSTGFMGMADARDRTVATNYLQEAIEDFKNMDFNQVKNSPITQIPDTKFSRGTYVLNLKEIDGVVTLKKVITQVRWIDRKGNIKTEKASTIIYNKPDTSEEGEEATELVLYAESYYTILPEHQVNLIAEIKDENGNIYDWDGPVTFSINVPSPGVGIITTLQPSQATSGVANCIFTANEGDDVEGTERIQATATVDGNDLTDTVNIRVTTGPVGIILEPDTEEDRVREAGVGVFSTINLTVVKADYIIPIHYDGLITLSAEGPGTLSDTTFSIVETEGETFTITSDNTPGIVEITASAPDLDMGYTEITFTGEPASIIIAPEKNTIYPGEEIDITVTIVDENNVAVEYDEEVNLSATPDYGSFSPNYVDFGSTSLLELESTFTAYTEALPGEKITLQAISGSLSGSAEITILSLLTPKYLKLFAHPTSFNMVEGVTYPTITATVKDVSGQEIVTTYNTSISFYSKIGETNFGGFPVNNPEIQTPVDGVAEVIFSSDIAGTTIITASSGDLILAPEGGIEVIFYNPADHIELSADPLSIDAGGLETSIITATVYDSGGNRVANYGSSDEEITLSTSLGIFPNSNEVDKSSIIINSFNEGQFTVALSSTNSGDAIVTAESSDGLSSNTISIEITGDVPSILTLGEVTNQTDYLITFDINVTESSFILNEIRVEWNNSNAPLDLIIIKSPSTEEGLTIPTTVSDSPSIITEIGKTIFKDVISNIGLSFTNGVSKMKQKDITVTFTEYDGTTTHVVSFRVPNM